MVEFLKNEDPDVFRKIRWLGKARSKDKFKFALQNVFVRKDSSICTDGKRLHLVVDDFGLHPGQYKFVVFRANEIQLELDEMPDAYPKVDNILSGVDDVEGRKELFFTGERVEFLKEIVDALPESEEIDPKYYDDVMFAHVPFKVSAGGDKHRAVHFEHQIYEALVMPRIKGTGEVKDVRPKQAVSKVRKKSTVGARAGNSGNGDKH